jgi:hypothetical protein
MAMLNNNTVYFLQCDAISDQHISTYDEHGDCGMVAHFGYEGKLDLATMVHGIRGWNQLEVVCGKPCLFKCSYIVESNINAVVPSKLDCQFPSHAMPLYAILHSVAP